MKTNSIVKITLNFLFLLGIFTACVKDKDFDTPQVACEEPTIKGSEVKMTAMLDDWNGDVVEFGDNTNYIIGYVISDDSTGNFYKELYLQDAPENPTAAVKLAIDMRSLYTRYDIGRKVYVSLQGLALDKIRGEMVLGELINGTIEMRENTVKENIQRSCEAVMMTPFALASPSDISEMHLGKLIQFNNMQFDLSLLEETFVDPSDSYDTHRNITSCEDGSVIKLETSTFASFKNNSLPQGAGSVSGVLTRDYGDDFYVLRVSSPDSFTFDGERCDPLILDCNNPNPIGGSTVVFNEDFEAYANNVTMISGWTNANVNGGKILFKVKSFGGKKYMQCSAYGSNEDPLEVWLVTPAINLDTTTDEELTFETKTGYNNGAALSVFVATDFTGDVATAEWMLVNAEIANGPASGYQNNFTSSGSVDVSCLNGDIYVAFRYLGGDSGITTTFQIDNIKVTGN